MSAPPCGRAGLAPAARLRRPCGLVVNSAGGFKDRRLGVVGEGDEGDAAGAVLIATENVGKIPAVAAILGAKNRGLGDAAVGARYNWALRSAVKRTPFMAFLVIERCEATRSQKRRTSCAVMQRTRALHCAASMDAWIFSMCAESMRIAFMACLLLCGCGCVAARRIPGGGRGPLFSGAIRGGVPCCAVRVRAALGAWLPGWPRTIGPGAAGACVRRVPGRLL